MSPALADSQPALMLTTGLPAVTSTQVVLLVGGLVVLMLVMARSKRARQDSLSRADLRMGNTADDQTLRDIGLAMTELDKLSRQMSGKIDLKLAMLQKVIKEADQTIERLARLQRTGSDAPILDVELESESPDLVDGNEGPHDAIYRLADSGRSPSQIARELSRHPGEVELILSLRRAKNSATTSARRQTA